MSALTDRYKSIRNVLRRLQRDAGDVTPTALQQMAELDVLCAELFAARKIDQYAKLAKLRFDLAVRLRIVPPPFQWAILSSSATIQRGQGAATLLLDEAGWLDPREELYETLSPMLASAGQPPLAILASTVGRRNSPLASVQKLAAEDVPKVYSFYSDDYTINPHIDPGYVGRERKRLPPILFSREWENKLAEGIDLLADRQSIESAFKSGWGPQSHGQRDVDYFLYYDGATVGLASAAIVHMDAEGVCYADEIHTWKGGRTRIDTDAVRRYLEDAFRRYSIRKARLESYQSLALEQALSKLGYPVELHTPTAQSMTTLWTTLQSVLTNNRLRLFPQGSGRQLREEMENAVTEPTASGVKVTGNPHPDLAVSVGGACVLALEAARSTDEGEPCFPNMGMYMEQLKRERGDPLRPDLPPDFFDP